MKQTQLVHEELERRHLLPQTHLVDAGYVDAGAIVESRELYGVELLGPVSRNNQWQAKAGKGYDQSGFALDFETQEATCPQVTKVCIGWKELISMVIPICSSDLIRKPVESVPVDPCVHAPKTSPDS